MQNSHGVGEPENINLFLRLSPQAYLSQSSVDEAGHSNNVIEFSAQMLDSSCHASKLNEGGMPIAPNVPRLMRRFMTARITLIFAFASMCLCLTSPSWASDFERGQKAFIAGDFAQALEIWRPLAQGGHPQAQYGLGAMHEYGRGLKPNDAEAVKWYLLAAEQGVSEAQYRLGVLYDYGWGVEADPTKAVQWYSQAAEGDHTFAQHDLAFMYVTGKGVSPDRVQAYKWLRIATTRRPDLMIKHLHSVSIEMKPEDIDRAEALATDWLQAR
ncbi:MAG: tetratricopeptide repeat protein [Pseudomonadota bacterium]